MDDRELDQRLTELDNKLEHLLERTDYFIQLLTQEDENTQEPGQKTQEEEGTTNVTITAKDERRTKHL